MNSDNKTKPAGTKGPKPEKPNAENNVKDNNTQKKPVHKEHNEEEKKGEKFQYKHRSRNYFKERTEVTLETVVPELPKKNEILPRPDDDALQVEVDKIEKEIEDTYKKMNDVARESRNKNYTPVDKTSEDLINLLKIKQEERKKADNEFKAASTSKDMYKKQLDEYYERGNDLRFKMKIPGKRSDLEATLKQLKDKQSKGAITLQEEKKLIKEISDLEKSLPYAGPLEELEEQSKEVKEASKKARQEANQKYEVLRLLRDEIRDIQDKLDKIREEAEKKKEETGPAIDKMKEEYRAKINTLKQKKRDLYNKQDQAWRKYEEQQAEIERIKYIKRKKEKLLRDEQRRVREEEWRKQREEQEAENKEIPYLPQIELCDLLIKYCNRINPASSEASTTASQVDKNTVIQESLQSDEWKSAKGQYIVSRKDKEEAFFAGKGKNKTQKKKPQQNKAEEEGSQLLNHQIETLNYFDEIKVSPPLFTDKLPETLRILQEKKAYFEKLSAEELKVTEERKNLPEEERKRLAEEDKQKKQQEQQAKKDEKRSPKKPKFDIESEQDFPKM